MRTFSYSARNSSGALQKGTLQAADRSAALRQLQDQGLTPLSVAMQAASAGGASGRGAGTLINMRVIILLLVALSVGALWYFMPARKKPVTTKPATTVKKEVAQRKLPQHTPAPTESPEPAGETEVEVKKPRTTPTKTETAEPAAPPRIIRLGKRQVDLSKAIVLRAERHSEEYQKNRPQPLFKSEIENMMAIYATPGVAMPPLPSNLPADADAQARAILDQDIVIYADDSEADIAKKEAVAHMKEQLRSHLDGGGSTVDFFNQLAVRQQEESERRTEGGRLVNELIKENRLEEAKALYKELNQDMADQGLPPVMISPKNRQLLRDGK